MTCSSVAFHSSVCNQRLISFRPVISSFVLSFNVNLTYYSICPPPSSSLHVACRCCVKGESILNLHFISAFFVFLPFVPSCWLPVRGRVSFSLAREDRDFDRSRAFLCRARPLLFTSVAAGWAHLISLCVVDRPCFFCVDGSRSGRWYSRREVDSVVPLFPSPTPGFPRSRVCAAPCDL